MSTEIKKLLKLLTNISENHSNLIAALTQAVRDQSVLIINGVPKCCHEECSRCATITYKTTGVNFCDYHGAEAIVLGELDINKFFDLPYAEGTRRTEDFCSAVIAGSPTTRH